MSSFKDHHRRLYIEKNHRHALLRLLEKSHINSSGFLGYLLAIPKLKVFAPTIHTGDSCTFKVLTLKQHVQLRFTHNLWRWVQKRNRFIIIGQITMFTVTRIFVRAAETVEPKYIFREIFFERSFYSRQLLTRRCAVAHVEARGETFAFRRKDTSMYATVCSRGVGR